MKINMIFALVMLIAVFSIVYLAENLTKAEQAKSTTGYDKIANGKEFQYLIIGDSIGRGSGAENQSETWFNQLEKLIRDKYGSSGKRFSVVQSGATTFEGIYKFQEANLPKTADLAFIVFGENDRKYMNSNQFSYFYEKLIRQVKQRYPSVEIITLTESCLNIEEFAEAIRRISSYYGAANIDMRVPFQNSKLSVEQLTTDLIHPNGKGYKLYADEVFKALQENMQKNLRKPFMPAPLNENADIKLQRNDNFIEKTGFAYGRDFLTSNAVNDYIEYEFTGPFLGVTVLRSEYGGLMDVYLNDQYYSTISTWWPLEKIRHLYIASDLGAGPHRVKFVVNGAKSPKNLTKKAEVKISSIIVAEQN